MLTLQGKYKTTMPYVKHRPSNSSRQFGDYLDAVSPKGVGKLHLC